MDADDRLQKNIRRTAGLHALRRVATIVDEENRNDAATANLLRWLSRYGWVVLLIAVVLVAYLTGVY
jgi:cation transport ATPase